MPVYSNMSVFPWSSGLDIKQCLNNGALQQPDMEQQMNPLLPLSNVRYEFVFL